MSFFVKNQFQICIWNHNRSFWDFFQGHMKILSRIFSSRIFTVWIGVWLFWTSQAKHFGGTLCLKRFVCLQLIFTGIKGNKNQKKQMTAESHMQVFSKIFGLKIIWHLWILQILQKFRDQNTSQKSWTGISNIPMCILQNCPVNCKDQKILNQIWCP